MTNIYLRYVTVTFMVESLSIANAVLVREVTKNYLIYTLISFFQKKSDNTSQDLGPVPEDTNINEVHFNFNQNLIKFCHISLYLVEIQLLHLILMKELKFLKWQRCI